LPSEEAGTKHIISDKLHSRNSSALTLAGLEDVCGAVDVEWDGSFEFVGAGFEFFREVDVICLVDFVACVFTDLVTGSLRDVVLGDLAGFDAIDFVVDG
jgi:hypothetical protein